MRQTKDIVILREYLVSRKKKKKGRGRIFFFFLMYLNFKHFLSPPIFSFTDPPLNTATLYYTVIVFYYRYLNCLFLRYYGLSPQMVSSLHFSLFIFPRYIYWLRRHRRQVSGTVYLTFLRRNNNELPIQILSGVQIFIF